MTEFARGGPIGGQPYLIGRGDHEWFRPLKKRRRWFFFQKAPRMNVTVNVSGSVLSGRLLVQAINEALRERGNGATGTPAEDDE